MSSLSTADLADHYREVMQKGSKSFSLAARLFDRERREAARHLYAWCRHCDDVIDRAPSPEAAAHALAELRLQTESAIAGAPSTHPAFLAFGRLCRDYNIPALYPLELLEGMRMDVEGYQYETEADLRLYCYRVAGVVGLMMVHVMGVSSSDALVPALKTGLAMQMTNIARDVREDFDLGRVYLPTEWFKAEGLDKPKVFDAATCAPVVARLLREADTLYAEGRAGLRYLPVRAAFAVAAAQTIYQSIGFLVRARGPRAWDQRAVVPLSQKLRVALRECFRLVPRLWQPWKAAAITATLPPPQSEDHEYKLL